MSATPSPSVPPAAPNTAVPSVPPTPLPPKKVRPQTMILLALLFLIVSIGAVIIIFFDQIAAYPLVQNWLKGIPIASRKNIVLPEVPPRPTPKPTPAYLPPGKQTYQINKNSDGSMPKIETLTLDPINVKQGEQQTLEVTITSPTPVTTVNLTLYADDKQKQTIALTQSSVDGSKSTWKATWTVNYSVWYRYVVMITATNAGGQEKAYVAPRTVGPIKKADLE